MRSGGRTIPAASHRVAADAVLPISLPDGFIVDGKLRIRRRIGVGGVGSVFEADQLSTGRRLAVKVIHPAFAAVAEVLERFRREAASLERVDSPYVVSIFDHGMASTPCGELPYLAMELVEGCTVGDLLDAGQMPFSEIVRVSAQALEALGDIHCRGVLHRDVKPENLFLAREAGGAERVKLIDFGLSRALLDAPPDRLTRLGFTVGTPMYMAPEQALGDVRADHRIDLFSMGVTLYEMVTGELPFDGPSYTVVLSRVLAAQPRLPRELRADVPAPLETVILRALEKDPDKRFPDAGSFRSALLHDDVTRATAALERLAS